MDERVDLRKGRALERAGNTYLWLQFARCVIDLIIAVEFGLFLLHVAGP